MKFSLNTIFMVAYDCFCLVLIASFDGISYSAKEEDGFVEVCVVLDGLIQREVEIELSTLDGSATGKEVEFKVEM